MKKIIAISENKAGVGNYRIVDPIKYLNNNFNTDIEIIFYDDRKLNYDYLSNFDIIIFQRIEQKSRFDLMLKLKQDGKIIIQDIDDLLLCLPVNNPHYKSCNPKTDNYKIHKQSLLLSDYITTTNKQLIQETKKFVNISDSKCKVFPNTLDTKDKRLSNKRHMLPKDKIIIGFQGSTSHYYDVDIIIQAVKIVLNKYDNVLFGFCSNIETFNKFNLDHTKSIYIQPEKEFDNYFYIPSLFDIALTPLEDTRFNECKSYLKLIEHGVYKVPVIATNIGDFNNINKQYNNSVFLTKNRCDKWVKSISKLIDDAQLRTEIGSNMYNLLNNGELSIYNISQNRYDFLNSL